MSDSESEPEILRCRHENLTYGCSEHAHDVGYKPRTALQRLAATLPSDKAPKKADRQRFGPSEDQYPASTFPAPLVLPEDELSWDPTYEPQSFKTWYEEPHRNGVTQSRRIIYIVASPAIAPSAAYVKDWAHPQIDSKQSPYPRPPGIEEVMSYLQAFYHGLPVKLLTQPQLKYVPWSSTALSKDSSPPYIGLRTGGEVIGVRTRPSKDGIFTGQLNLNDLLDVAIAILPKDAYALLMLTDHDVYEDEEDDFCCGRAYGGSRVAVVSTARYNPDLDKEQRVEIVHAWPASHCRAYIDTCCETTPKKKRKEPDTYEIPSAMRSAIKAMFPQPAKKFAGSHKLWLLRLCKTASHELGHCFGIDHCVYYACIMQGTAGLTEDARQPPYLCPVDLAKVLCATDADSVQRYRALLAFCERFGNGQKSFDGFAAWLGVRIKDIESQREVILLD